MPSQNDRVQTGTGISPQPALTLLQLSSSASPSTLPTLPSAHSFLQSVCVASRYCQLVGAGAEASSIAA